VDADEHIAPPRRRLRMILMRSSVSMSEWRYRTLSPTSV
jgi:hypothetical protein